MKNYENVEDVPHHEIQAIHNARHARPNETNFMEPFVMHRGKSLERDTSAKAGVMYTKPVREHWWQFWRKKQTYIDFKEIDHRDQL